MIFDAPRGSGPPLATLHGFLGQASSFDAVLVRLEATVARGRLPGHSREPWAARDGDLLGVADEIAEALPFDEPCVLLGYSMGARVALAMTVRHPSRVRCAVLVGAHPGLDEGPERAARRAWDDEAADLLERDGLEEFVDAWEQLPVLGSQLDLPEDLIARRRAERLDHRAPELAHAMRILGLGRMPPLARTSRARADAIVLVTGALDEKFDAVARSWSASAPGITHRVVDGAGHDVGLEAPEALAVVVGAALG